jgi:hypothetical protein
LAANLGALHTVEICTTICSSPEFAAQWRTGVIPHRCGANLASGILGLRPKPEGIWLLYEYQGRRRGISLTSGGAGYQVVFAVGHGDRGVTNFKGPRVMNYVPVQLQLQYNATPC